MKLSDVKVGDDVMQLRSHGGAHRLRVTKVGRKYLYLENRGTGSRDGYDRETGRAADGYGRVETIEAYQRRCDEVNALKELRDLGVEVMYGSARNKVLEIYAALKPVLLPSEPQEPK